MTSILTAVGAAMREVRQDKTRARLAGTGDRLGQAAGRAGRRHHQWRHRGRRRLHHDSLMSAARPSRRIPSSPSARAIFRDGKILLVRRASSPAKGFYSLPGGRVEFGEIAAHGAASRGRRGNRAARSRSLASPAGARCCREPAAAGII